jgi:ATP/ADP translocase
MFVEFLSLHIILFKMATLTFFSPVTMSVKSCNRIPKEQQFIHVYKFSSKIFFTITYVIYLIIDSIIFNLYLTTSIKFINKSLAWAFLLFKCNKIKLTSRFDHLNRKVSL